MSRFFVYAVSTFLLVGCTSMCSGSRKDMTAEEVVEAYLDIALNLTDVEQREYLLEYTTGNLRNAIEEASDEIIKTAYVQRKYTLNRYTVVERRDRTPRETEITFELEYLDFGVDPNLTADTAPKVVTENTVSVIKEKGAWYIRDVLGNKTSIDFPVSEAAKITAKSPE